MFSDVRALAETLVSVEQRLAQLVTAQGQTVVHLHRLERSLMSSLETLQQQVAQSNSVITSAVTLISGLQSQLSSAIQASKDGDDHAALDALSAQLAASTSALAAAIPANTAPVDAPAA